VIHSVAGVQRPGLGIGALWGAAATACDCRRREQNCWMGVGKFPVGLKQSLTVWTS
jgi:hypothetical protein